jgi:hypothetical protein
MACVMLVLYESDFSAPGSIALLSALEVDAPDA